MQVEVYIAAAMRTPIGKAKGVFRNLRADDLLIQLQQGFLRQHSTLDPALIDDVIIGCSTPEGELGMNLARNCAVLAGLPQSVPGVTVNRLCTSGLQAVAMAADRIANGSAAAIIAGGVDSVSRIPFGGFHPSINPQIFVTEAYENITHSMGLVAEVVSKKWGITREAQDQFALRSHNLAMQYHKRGYARAEIMPIKLSFSRAEKHVSKAEVTTITADIAIDESPRHDINSDKLSAFRPAYSANGSVTLANCAQLADGAAVLLVANSDFIYKNNLVPLVRFCGYSVTGVDASSIGVGSAKAIPRALGMLGLQQQQIDSVELHEASAAQALAVIKSLQLNEDAVNPHGGAIAYGHAVGASGATRVVSLSHDMQRNNLRYGLVSICGYGGIGMAAVFAKV